MATQIFEITLDGQDAEDDFYANVVALTVEEGTSAPSRLSLQLNSDLLDTGEWSFLDDQRLEPFGQIGVSIGFMDAGPAGPGPMQRIFDGYITNVELSAGSEPGSTRLELTALDASVLMSLEEKIASYPNMSDAEIVQQIVGSYGISLQADATQTVHRDTDTTVVQRGTDIQFIQALAYRNGFEFYLEPDASNVVAYFRAPQLDTTPQSDLAIQFGADSNLRSFTARVRGQRPLNVKAMQMDVQANSPNTAIASQTQLTLLGQRDLDQLVGSPLDSLVSPSDAQAEMLVLGSPTSDQTELQTLVQAVRDEAGWFIEASGEINSMAYVRVLRPRRLVLVKGAGTQYSGKYYVTRVAHEVRTDGSYVQRFEARRNARDLDGSEQFASGRR